MIQYDDDQLGAGDDEGADTVDGASGDRHHRAEYDDMLLQTALNDFEKNFAITHKLYVTCTFFFFFFFFFFSFQSNIVEIVYL